MLVLDVPFGSIALSFRWCALGVQECVRIPFPTQLSSKYIIRFVSESLKKESSQNAAAEKFNFKNARSAPSQKHPMEKGVLTVRNIQFPYLKGKTKPSPFALFGQNPVGHVSPETFR